MDFSYSGYKRLMGLLKEHHYAFCDYANYEQYDRCVILRHDIDNSIIDAVKLAEVEASLGITSTYFVLVSSDFYNIFSKESRDLLKQLRALGHKIGLHFDETVYGENISTDQMIDAINMEAALLATSINNEVTLVSMHRPSKSLLDADLVIPGMINSYGTTFFREFKYLSDSRCHWREPVEEIIQSEQYARLHILTHAFWYHENSQSLADTVSMYIKGGNADRYAHMLGNISDLPSIVSRDFLKQ